MHNRSMAAKRLKTPRFCCSFHVTPAQDSLKVSLLKTGKHWGRLCHQLLTQTKQNSKSPRAGAAAGLTHGVTGLSTASHPSKQLLGTTSKGTIPAGQGQLVWLPARAWIALEPQDSINFPSILSPMPKVESSNFYNFIKIFFSLTNT